ncbi:MAG TPA: hypothetical protein VFD68_03450, partial [Gemmatimonadales bacterium]|nr:hypothetical protein [Gemmatimonadales bacterium]
SFDDGDHWQSLRLNLPATAVRDLVVHDSDLVVGTHGRSFWILDGIAPLRELRDATDTARATGAYLFPPAGAVRARWNENTDTPLPIDEPAGQNPPDGAILDYFLPRAAAGPVLLEILDRAGAVVRRFSSDDVPEPPDSGLNIPPWWIRRPQRLARDSGMHRFVWDLHGPPPPALRHDYPIAAVLQNTPHEPRGPWVLPGRYVVRLTVGGRAYTQPLTVRMDPRVPIAAAALARQRVVAISLVEGLERDSAALERVRGVRKDIAGARTGKGAPVTTLDSLDRAAGELESGQGGLTRLNGQLADLYGLVEGVDAAPTQQAEAQARDLRRRLASLEGEIRALVGRFRSLTSGLQ